jgi:hypothetical protein
MTQGADLTQQVTSAVEITYARKSLLPNGGDIIFMCPIYLMLVLLPNLVLSDGSTGWHLIAGQYMIDHLRIPHHDLISYTFPNKPWVPYEWLFDVLAALLVRLGGLNLLAVATASAISWLFLSLYGDARRTGCHFLVALVITLLSCITSSVHWLARPHLFTFFGVYLFARSLEAFHWNTLPSRQLIGILGLSMLVWSNAHPGFLFGFAMVTIYLLSEAISMVALPPGVQRDLARKRAGTLLASLPLIAAASLINPNGLALYPYLAAYLRQAFGSVGTALQELMSPTFHGALHATSLELLFGAIVLGLATSRRKPWLGQFLLIVAFAHLALSGMYNEPMFAIVAVPFIANLFADNTLMALLGSGPPRSLGRLEPLKQRWQFLARNFDAMERRCTLHLFPIGVTAALVISCIAAGKITSIHSLVSSQFDPRTKPTATLTYIDHNHLRWDRGFNLDNWGGYIRYTTGHPVFIDDRLDFYGPEFYRRYEQAIAIQPGWEKFLDDYNVEWVLFPKNTPLTTMLQHTPTWQLKTEDQAADLFVRHPVH